MVSLHRVGVGLEIDIGSLRIRLAHPMYWGLLKAIKISRSRVLTHS